MVYDKYSHGRNRANNKHLSEEEREASQQRLHVMRTLSANLNYGKELPDKDMDNLQLNVSVMSTILRPPSEHDGLKFEPYVVEQLYQKWDSLYAEVKIISEQVKPIQPFLESLNVNNHRAVAQKSMEFVQWDIKHIRHISDEIKISVAGLNDKVLSLQQAMCDYQHKLCNNRMEIETLITKVGSGIQRLEAVQNQVDIAERQLDFLPDHKKWLKSTVDAEIAPLSQQVHKVDVKLDATWEDVTAIRQDSATIQRDVDGVTQKVITLHSQAKSIESKLDDTRKEVTDLRQDVTSLDSKLDDTRKEVTDLRRVVTSLDSKLDATRKEVTDLRADVTDLRADVNGLRQNVRSLGSNLDATRKEVTDLRADVTDLRQNVGSLDSKLDARLDELRSMLTVLIKSQPAVVAPLP